MALDQSVDGFGAAVAGAVGVEVGEQGLSPPLQGAAEVGQLRDWAGRQGVDEPLGDLAALGLLRVPVGQAQTLGDGPGEADFFVLEAGVEGGGQAGPLPVGELLRTGSEDVADPVERVVAVTAVSEGVLLDPAADLVDDARAELDDVEGVQDGGGVLQLVVDGVLVAVERAKVATSTRLVKASPRA